MTKQTPMPDPPDLGNMRKWRLQAQMGPLRFSVEGEGIEEMLDAFAVLRRSVAELLPDVLKALRIGQNGKKPKDA